MTDLPPIELTTRFLELCDRHGTQHAALQYAALQILADARTAGTTGTPGERRLAGVERRGDAGRRGLPGGGDHLAGEPAAEIVTLAFLHRDPCGGAAVGSQHRARTGARTSALVGSRRPRW